MKKFLFIILIISTLSLLFSCAEPIHKETEIIDANNLESGSLRKTVIYLKTDSGYVVPVMKRIPWEEGIGKAALSYLIESESNESEYSKCGLNAVAPKGTEFELRIDDEKNSVVNVKNLPNFENTEDEGVFLQAVVNTLTEFASIDTVSVRFDGKKLSKMHNGTRVNENMSRFKLNPINTEMETSTGSTPISVYVPDNTCNYIIPVTAYADKNAGFETAMKVFCEYGNKMNNGIPYGTYIESASIEDNVATVIFSNDFAQITNNDLKTLEMIYKAAFLTAKEFDSKINELKLCTENESISCASFSPSEVMYINEWK